MGPALVSESGGDPAGLGKMGTGNKKGPLAS